MLQPTEEQFRKSVRQLATLWGWSMYHTYRSDRSDPGWPDEVFCRPPRLIFVEFKIDAAHSKLTWTQREWLERLQAAGQEVAVWRPSNLEEIKRVLGRPPSPRAVLRLQPRDQGSPAPRPARRLPGQASQREPRT